MDFDYEMELVPQPHLKAFKWTIRNYKKFPQMFEVSELETLEGLKWSLWARTGKHSELEFVIKSDVESKFDVRVEGTCSIKNSTGDFKEDKTIECEVCRHSTVGITNLFGRILAEHFTDGTIILECSMTIFLPVRNP